MQRSRRALATLIAAGSALVVLSYGCADRPAPADPAAGDPALAARGRVASVVVSPDVATLAVGQTIQLGAQAYDRAGAPLSGITYTWSTSSAGVASLSTTTGSTVLVTGRAPGSATVRATGGKRHGSASITVTGTTPPPPTTTAVLVGAGDIADCTETGHEATAALIRNIPGTVFTTGDNAYPDGRATDFANCYNPSWGQFRDRTRPSPGNHDYHVTGAADYYAYFGANAGPAGRGYYSYELGGWHVISLNSEVSMTSTSPQVTWLKTELAATPAKCTIAYWHRPRFSSGDHGNVSSTQPLWEALYADTADIILGGHDHLYERFAPQTPTGAAAPNRGIRQFVVGTGGQDLYSWSSTKANSEFRFNSREGVLKLELSATSYKWSFITTDGLVRDSGTGNCN